MFEVYIIPCFWFSIYKTWPGTCLCFVNVSEICCTLKLWVSLVKVISSTWTFVNEIFSADLFFCLLLEMNCTTFLSSFESFWLELFGEVSVSLIYLLNLSYMRVWFFFVEMVVSTWTFVNENFAFDFTFTAIYIDFLMQFWGVIRELNRLNHRRNISSEQFTKTRAVPRLFRAFVGRPLYGLENLCRAIGIYCRSGRQYETLILTRRPRSFISFVTVLRTVWCAANVPV